MKLDISTHTRPCAVCGISTNLYDPDVGTPLCCDNCANRYWRETSIACSDDASFSRHMAGELILARIGVIEDFIENFSNGMVPDFDSGCAISAPNDAEDKAIMDSLDSLGRTVYAIIRVRGTDGKLDHTLYLFADNEDVQKLVNAYHDHKDSLESIAPDLGSGIFRVRAFSPDMKIDTVCVRRKAGAIVLEENNNEK